MENRHDIISRINEKYAAMSKGHKAIATYIMEHYDQAAFMTAAVRASRALITSR